MKPALRRRLGTYLDGELSPAESREIEALLRSSPDAARQFGELAALHAFARGHRGEAGDDYFAELPSVVRRRVVGLRVARAAMRPWVWFRRPPVWGWAAAVALLLAVVTPLTLRQSPAPEAPGRSSSLATPAEVPRQAAAEAPTDSPPMSRPLAKALPDATAPVPVLERRADRADEARVLAARPPTAEPVLEKASPAVAAEVAPAATPPAAPTQPSGAMKERLAASSVQTSEVTEGRVAPGPSKALASRAPRAEAADAGVSGGVAAGLAEDKLKATEVQERSRTGGETQLGFARGSGARSDAEAIYHALLAREATTKEAAQSLRDECQRFVERFPASPHADEALARGVEAGALLWRLSGRRADRAWVEKVGRGYLKRSSASAPQRERVARALADLNE